MILFNSGIWGICCLILHHMRLLLRFSVSTFCMTLVKIKVIICSSIWRKCLLSLSSPYSFLGYWPSKNLPAAPAACLVGLPLVILIVLNAGASSHCFSHKTMVVVTSTNFDPNLPLMFRGLLLLSGLWDNRCPVSHIPSPWSSGSLILQKSLMFWLLRLIYKFYLRPWRLWSCFWFSCLVSYWRKFLVLSHKNLESVSWWM